MPRGRGNVAATRAGHGSVALCLTNSSKSLSGLERPAEQREQPAKSGNQHIKTHAPPPFDGRARRNLDKNVKTLLLVDGSSYLYRAFHALPNLRSPAGQPTGAVYGMVNMLKKLEKDTAFDYSAVVFDAKGKTFRDALFPDYKAHRPSMPDDLAAQIPPVHAAVRALGWPLLMEGGVEADDVIGTLAVQAVALGWQVWISTGDKDMAQLVNPQVTLLNTMSNEVLDPAGVLAKFGVTPAQIVDYLALTGDKVDNVPGVDGCGPKTAVKWLNAYGDLAGVVAHAEAITGKVGDKLRAALPHLPLSQQLVTIKTDVPLHAVLPEGLTGLRHGAPQTDLLLPLYQQQGFKTWHAELQGEAAAPPAPPPTTALPRPAASLPPLPMDDLFAEPPAAAAGAPLPSTGQGGGSSAAIPSAAAEPPAAAVPATVLTPHYETLQTEADFARWLALLEAAPYAAIDTETTGLDTRTAELVGISFCLTAGHAAYLPLAHRDAGGLLAEQLPRAATLARLKPWLENPARHKVGQNLKFDCHVLANHGITLAGIADDTLLLSYVLESHLTHNLDDLAVRHLGIQGTSYASLCGKGAKQISFAEVDIPAASHYAAEDADLTLRLAQVLKAQLTPALEQVYRSIELPTLGVLFRAERQGVAINREELAHQSHDLGLRLQTLEAQAHAAAGQPFNLNSPKQLQEILFDKLGIPTKGMKKTPTGAISTNEDALEKLAADYPLPRLILSYRGLAKLKSTYTDKLPSMVDSHTGRIHTHYLQSVAVTGRLASAEPNLQNIPIRSEEGRRVRRAFIAPAHAHIVSADYSQIELRIMAHLSDDAGLLAAFTAGEDVHRATAAEVFGVPLAEVTAQQRRYAKTINFGLIYGMSAFGLATQLDVGRAAAQGFIDRYFVRYPGVASYMERTREAVRQQGYVETVFGRRLYLPDIQSPNPAKRQAAERAAINAPMQGTAADLIKLAMIAVDQWLTTEGLASKLVMQVHDELVLEVPDAELDTVKAALPRLMAGVAALKVPLLAEVGSGESWEAAH